VVNTLQPQQVQEQLVRDTMVELPLLLLHTDQEVVVEQVLLED
jgi:hypothetical protein